MNLPMPIHARVFDAPRGWTIRKEMTMAKATLFKAACAAAMLAATPVLAQSNNPAGATGAGAASTTPPAHEATPSSAMSGHMHHSAMGEHHVKSHSSADSQDAAVNRLNDESYQAAQKGEAFDAGTPATPSGGTSGGAAPPPGGKL
jgi:hypothetical protein